MNARREIKFRTWDTENQEFSEWTNRDPFFSTSHDQIFFWERVKKEDGSYDGDIVIEDTKDRFILQQYTGLKDMNGKGIYEGDMCAFDSEDFRYESAGVVIYEDGSFKIKYESDTYPFIINKKIGKEYLTVIGHRYEKV